MFHATMGAMTQLAVLLPRDLRADQVLPFARRAEELGIGEIWVVEDLAFRGGFAQAGALLAGTGRVRVGIGILPAAVRNVAFTAMEAATLAQLFPGRLTLGVGHGMPSFLQAVGAWPDRPLALLEGYTRTLRALLRGERVSELGLHEVALDPSALPEVPPAIVLGVRGPKSLAMAGRVADGVVLAEPVTPQYVQAALAQAAPAGPFSVVAFNAAAVDEDPARAIDRVRPALEWIGEPDWAPHIAPLPFAAQFAALRAQCATRQEFAAALPPEWVRELAVVGTPIQVRERIAALGVDTAVLFPIGEPFAALESFARVRDL